MTDGLGLGGVYGETLGRIKGQGEEEARLGMAALMWISHSERPLKVDELCHALGVEIGAADLDADNVPSIGTVLSCCQGLISIDNKSSKVRLIHFTLQEYLRTHPELFDRAHSTMAETCLSYLNSCQVKALSGTLSSGLRYRLYREPRSLFSDTPFLEYASLYWGAHTKRDLSACAIQLALNIFEDSHHISTEILLNMGELPWPYSWLDGASQFSGLHCASFFGIVEIVASLLEVEGCDINQKDCIGNTTGVGCFEWERRSSENATRARRRQPKRTK